MATLMNSSAAISRFGGRARPTRRSCVRWPSARPGPAPVRQRASSAAASGLPRRGADLSEPGPRLLRARGPPRSPSGAAPGTPFEQATPRRIEEIAEAVEGASRLRQVVTRCLVTDGQCDQPTHAGRPRRPTAIAALRPGSRARPRGASMLPRRRPWRSPRSSPGGPARSPGWRYPERSASSTAGRSCAAAASGSPPAKATKPCTCSAIRRRGGWWCSTPHVRRWAAASLASATRPRWA